MYWTSSWTASAETPSAIAAVAGKGVTRCEVFVGRSVDAPCAILDPFCGSATACEARRIGVPNASLRRFRNVATLSPERSWPAGMATEFSEGRG